MRVLPARSFMAAGLLAGATLLAAGCARLETREMVASRTIHVLKTA